jgi:uncharacterized OB-fold protein
MCKPDGVSGAKSTVAAVEGWFTTDDGPRLLGTRCTTCGTVFFPKATGLCRNPDCSGTDLVETPLSTHGTIWSYTDAQYKPPPPFVPPTDPFEPFAIAAVELAEEQLIVLGQMAAGVGVADLSIGMEVDLVVEALFEDDEHTYVVWKWSPR